MQVKDEFTDRLYYDGKKHDLMDSWAVLKYCPWSFWSPPRPGMHPPLVRCWTM